MYALSDALFTAALEAAEANYSIFLCKLYGRAAAEVNYSLFSKANFYGCAAAEVNYSIFSNRTFTQTMGFSVVPCRVLSVRVRALRHCGLVTYLLLPHQRGKRVNKISSVLDRVQYICTAVR